MAIPARGGSKRLLRKNLYNLNNMPMIAYTIDSALKAGLSDRVYVCTEDDEIAEVAEKYGAEVFKISEEMTGDLVSSTVPCLALYDHLVQDGQEFEYIFNLQPTSPLRSSDDIVKSFSAIQNTGSDFLVSTTEIDPHYFHWALIEKETEWRMYFEKKYLMERPLLPKVHRPNGAIKLARAEKLKQTGNFFGEKLTTYNMPDSRSIHVATLFDVQCILGILSNKNLSI